MIAAVILAAGQSSRMGRHKLLLLLLGKPLLLHVVEAALAACVDEVVVVVGYQAAAVRSLLAGYPVRLVENPDYQQGQSTSLRAGILALEPEVEAALFLLGDQPLVPATLLNRLIAVYRAEQRDVVVPTYAGQRGNPVLFSRALFPQLQAITGDQGGRSVLMTAQRDGRVATVAVDDTLINRDVDTWEEYQQLIADIGDG
jgi:molybdenum cofactor cytidylyltransferase